MEPFIIKLLEFLFGGAGNLKSYNQKNDVFPQRFQVEGKPLARACAFRAGI